MEKVAGRLTRASTFLHFFQGVRNKRISIIYAGYGAINTQVALSFYRLATKGRSEGLQMKPTPLIS